jgi:hypothetical protein
MPDFTSDLQKEVNDAIELAKSGERIRVEASRVPALKGEMTIRRLELMYEVAFLKMFASWEGFLQDVFLRYLCGYRHRGGQLTPTTSFSRTLLDARSRVLGTGPFVLWHNPQSVLRRSRRFFNSGPHEVVIDSNRVRLSNFSAIRHHIAHEAEDTRSEFDTACMALCGKRFRGGRPGAFLRENFMVGMAPSSWIEEIGRDLCGLAGQIVP